MQGGDGIFGPKKKNRGGSVARITRCASELLDRFGRSACVGVDVFHARQFSGQGSLSRHARTTVRKPIRRRTESRVSQTSDAWTATRSPGSHRNSERVVDGDAGAKEWCGLLGGQVVRESRPRLRRARSCIPA